MKCGEFLLSHLVDDQVRLFGATTDELQDLAFIRLPQIDLTGLAQSGRSDEARRRLLGEAARPFDLTRDQPLRGEGTAAKCTTVSWSATRS